MMANKLFIVCPYSNMECFLRNKYGNDIYFLTFTGAVFLNQEFEYLSAITQFLVQEDIKSVYIVNDTSCRFINGIINKKKLLGIPAENVLEELYVEHYFSEFKDQTVLNQQTKLAELNIIKQGHEIVNSTTLGNHISDFTIKIKGLITSKDKNTFMEIQIENKTQTIYEF